MNVVRESFLEGSGEGISGGVAVLIDIFLISGGVAVLIEVFLSTETELLRAAGVFDLGLKKS